MTRRSLAALTLALFAGVAVAGGDEPPAPPSARSAPPEAGFNCKVKLTNGRSVTGVVRAEGLWERRDDKEGWVSCAKDDPGACVRLSYVGGRQGVMQIAAKDVASAENQGAISGGELEKLVKAAADADAASQADRDRVRREQRAKRAAEAEAAAAKEIEKAAQAKEAEAAAQAKADAELLAKFPPDKWGAERRDEIEKRRLLLHVNPTDEEREFLAKYDAWARAAAAAKAAEAKAATESKDSKDAKQPKDSKAPKDSKPPAGE